MVKKKRSDREKKNQCNISMLQHNTKKFQSYWLLNTHGIAINYLNVWLSASLISKIPRKKSQTPRNNCPYCRHTFCQDTVYRELTSKMGWPVRSATKLYCVVRRKWRRPRESERTEIPSRSRQDTCKDYPREIPRVPSFPDRTRPPLRGGDRVDSVRCEGTEWNNYHLNLSP